MDESVTIRKTHYHLGTYHNTVGSGYRVTLAKRIAKQHTLRVLQTYTHMCQQCFATSPVKRARVPLADLLEFLEPLLSARHYLEAEEKFTNLRRYVENVYRPKPEPKPKESDLL